jgi:hypothetical protein
MGGGGGGSMDGWKNLPGLCLLHTDADVDANANVASL